MKRLDVERHLRATVARWFAKAGTTPSGKTLPTVKSFRLHGIAKSRKAQSAPSAANWKSRSRDASFFFAFDLPAELDTLQNALLD